MNFIKNITDVMKKPAGKVIPILFFALAFTEKAKSQTLPPSDSTNALKEKEIINMIYTESLPNPMDKRTYGKWKYEINEERNWTHRTASLRLKKNNDIIGYRGKIKIEIVRHYEYESDGSYRFNHEEFFLTTVKEKRGHHYETIIYDYEADGVMDEEPFSNHAFLHNYMSYSYNIFQAQNLINKLPDQYKVIAYREVLGGVLESVIEGRPCQTPE